MFARCVDLVRYEGHICLQGYYADPIGVEFHRTHLKRPTVSFPCGWEAERDEELVADLADGRLALAPLITHRIPYRDAEQAYELVSQHPDASLGMVLTWTDEAGA
jgi:threonine dehydrogenase-like Zn-dependent dehydrogenase